jgi:cellulose synthase/poly-beta-1,6-N-acetylglucosamine synthase-like glycosyltransferase
MVEFGWAVVGTFNLIILAYFFALNSVYLITTVISTRFLMRYVKRLRTVDVEQLIVSGATPPITLVAPAYNEEANCVEATRSLLTIRYPNYEILVVNDGSPDQTLQLLIAAFDMTPAARLPSAKLETARIREVYRSRQYPNLWLLDKENGGKADAINAGLEYCRTPLFCVIDADSLLERDALIRVTRPFLEDARTVAVGGIVRIVNGSTVRHGVVEKVRLPHNLLARLQVLEYLRSFLSGRVAWSELNAGLIISGAFGLFRRSIVVDAGGFATDTVGEDMEIVVRIHRYCREHDIPYRIGFVPDPVAWTECPETIRGMSRQRDRWQRGLIESLSRHRRMLLNPKYGNVGLVAYPYFVFLEMLGPVIEMSGYIAFLVTLIAGRASLPYVVAFLSLAILFGIALSAAAVALEELSLKGYPRNSDLARLIWLSVVENIGYRQLNSFWRMQGVISAVRRVTRWGQAQRKGFQTSSGGS